MPFFGYTYMSGKSMDSYVVLLVILASSLLAVSNEIEDLGLEKQLKLLNKPAVKSISNEYGDIYDCVDFYQQPAFDHPLLKNHTFHYQMKPRIFHEKTVYQASSNVAKHVPLRRVGCPIGTVPVRSITKEDLIRERLASKIRPLGGDDTPGADYAVVQSRFGQENYIAGIAGAQSAYSPPIEGQQYSAGRMKLQNGNDSIEVGWRVDPTLYNDNYCRLYIRTDAGQTHCFNTRCPGFVMVDNLTLETPLTLISKPGEIWEVMAKISRDPNSGDWWLLFGIDDAKIGFWPKTIFSAAGLQNPASEAEWGGETFSPQGVIKPAMGSGSMVSGDTNKDAFFRQIQRKDPKDQNWYKPEQDEIEVFVSDRSKYAAVDEGYVGDLFGHLMFYGGPGGP